MKISVDTAEIYSAKVSEAIVIRISVWVIETIMQWRNGWVDRVYPVMAVGALRAATTSRRRDQRAEARWCQARSLEIH